MSKKNVYKKEAMKMPEEHFGRAKALPIHEHSYFGMVIALLLLVLVALFIGIYLWSRLLQTPATVPPVSTSTRPTAAENKEPESTNARADTEALNTMSTSDDLNTIQADLSSTNLDTLTSDIPAIDSELESSTSVE